MRKLGEPGRISPPVDVGQWWWFDDVLMAQLITAKGGDMCYLGTSALSDLWPHDQRSYISTREAQCLWSSRPLRREVDSEYQERLVLARIQSLKFGQVRMLDDQRVFFVTPHEKDEAVVLRAVFPLRSVPEEDLRASSVVYDPNLPQTPLAKTLYERLEQEPEVEDPKAI